MILKYFLEAAYRGHLVRTIIVFSMPRKFVLSKIRKTDCKTDCSLESCSGELLQSKLMKAYDKSRLGQQQRDITL